MERVGLPKRWWEEPGESVLRTNAPSRRGLYDFSCHYHHRVRPGQGAMISITATCYAANG